MYKTVLPKSVLYCTLNLLYCNWVMVCSCMFTFLFLFSEIFLSCSHSIVPFRLSSTLVLEYTIRRSTKIIFFFKKKNIKYEKIGKAPDLENRCSSFYHIDCKNIWFGNEEHCQPRHFLLPRIHTSVNKIIEKRYTICRFYFVPFNYEIMNVRVRMWAYLKKININVKLLLRFRKNRRISIVSYRIVHPDSLGVIPNILYARTYVGA